LLTGKSNLIKQNICVNQGLHTSPFYYMPLP
jgi:hypothetical protein